MKRIKEAIMAKKHEKKLKSQQKDDLQDLYTKAQSLKAAANDYEKVLEVRGHRIGQELFGQEEGVRYEVDLDKGKIRKKPKEE